jgi:CHASE3 domain sensor protein
MVRTIAELRQTSDEDLIVEHDRLAGVTSVGTAYYMDELERRSRDRATQAAQALAQRAFWMTVASTVLALVAVVTSVLALLFG